MANGSTIEVSDSDSEWKSVGDPEGKNIIIADYPCDLKCLETLPKNIKILKEIHKVGEDGGIECSISYKRLP